MRSRGTVLFGLQDNPRLIIEKQQGFVSMFRHYFSFTEVRFFEDNKIYYLNLSSLFAFHVLCHNALALRCIRSLPYKVIRGI